MYINKNFYRNKASVRGSTFFISTILILSVIIASLAHAYVPHPISGTATWEGGGNAAGASVTVTSSLGTLTDTVTPDGNWRVDCGDPGPNWPPGTTFTVTITGSGAHQGWSGSNGGTVSGYSNNVGNTIVYNDAPGKADTPSGPATRNTGESGSYTTSATDSGEQVQ